MGERALSLRGRLAGMMVLLFAGGTVVLHLAARTYANTAADRSFDRLLAGSALSIAETLSIAGGEVQVDLPYAALDMLSAAPDDRVFYRVFGPDERNVTGYDDLPALREPRRRGGSPVAESTRFFNADYRGETLRFALLGREIAEPGISGWVWVQVGQTRRAREAFADDLVFGALLPIGMLTVLALALVWFGIARALRPLERVGQDLGRREPADLHPVDAPVPGEIVPLVDAINGFMRRLDANMDTLRNFIAQAAHQMRTPLAALRAQAQLALDDEPDDIRRSLVAVERNAAKLTRLLDQLLSDATVIHRSDIRRFERFDLVPAIRGAIRDSVPVTAGVVARFHPALDEAPYVGDALLTGEALKNLIDNALRHGRGDQGGIDIDLAIDDGGCYSVRVADRGPGIPPEARASVFERFARGGSEAPGAGLGMAIVRQAVESQGGRIVLGERDGGGLVVTMLLPVPKP